ncbi:hypothetical protein [uncultured Cohaesibacter sp.]|uniref:hypothetical protein n=1 Tax=uncultured Cohaesibacter sp. TaxID=1002546 RepID=UPI0029C7E718|nr:hypothetical protein [uncultured Cohaesibacter sp.]
MFKITATRLGLAVSFILLAFVVYLPIELRECDRLLEENGPVFICVPIGFLAIPVLVIFIALLVIFIFLKKVAR